MDLVSWLRQQISATPIGPQGLVSPLPKITVGDVTNQASQNFQQANQYQKDINTINVKQMRQLPLTPEEQTKLSEYTSNLAGNMIMPVGSIKRIAVKAVTPVVEEIAARTAPKFEGLTDLTTSVIQKLRGSRAVAPETITNLAKTQGVKEAERSMLEKVLAKYQGVSKIPTAKFAQDVKDELLPLSRSNTVGENIIRSGYERITLPAELRGNVANYFENVYQSPIKTSAGGIHYGEATAPNYFAHTRIEDVSPNNILKTQIARMGEDYGQFRQRLQNEATTRRVIELQSDLFQKGRLEQESLSGQLPSEVMKDPNNIVTQRIKDLAKLEPYKDTWHERVIREEVKKAAQDGKTKLQFPTGETAMKIEGLGEAEQFQIVGKYGRDNIYLNPQNMKVGQEVISAGVHNNENVFVITDVLEDGKFKAVPRNVDDTRKAWTTVKDTYTPPSNQKYLARNSQTGEVISFSTSKEADKYIEKAIKRGNENYAEIFDISGKIDQSNPIYKFYESEVGRYLKNKYGAAQITDPQGIKWWELNIKPEQGRLPIEAFGVGALALPRKKEENQKQYYLPAIQ